MYRLYSYIRTLRLIPAIYYYLTSPHKLGLDYERDCWIKARNINKHGFRGWILLMNSLETYRSLFYFRVGKPWLKIFSKGTTNLEFYTNSDNIGWGLIIWHGFSTVINVNKMGKDCQIWQNVTIGNMGSGQDVDNKPIIGDRVCVCANSVVIGKINLADDVIVGAGTIVNKSITEKGAIIVGQPFRTILKD